MTEAAVLHRQRRRLGAGGGLLLPALRSLSWMRRRCVPVLVLALLTGAGAGAQNFGPSAAAARVASPERSVGDWLARLQAGAQSTSYSGIYVVSTPADASMGSARIWHVQRGGVQWERVETLSGVARASYRRNEQVVSVLPESGQARIERRQLVNLFPNLLNAGTVPVEALYRASLVGHGRVAGHQADVVQFAPRDALRYGYRIWSERQSGLLIKLQVLDGAGHVLEQSAFSELQLGTPVDVREIAQRMKRAESLRVERVQLARADAQAEGWRQRTSVPGFEPQGLFRRAAASGGAAPWLQWIFSDGLASVSLFVEPVRGDAQDRREGKALAVGATRALVQRVKGRGDSATWLVTAVGEVPEDTLRALIESIERVR